MQNEDVVKTVDRLILWGVLREDAARFRQLIVIALFRNLFDEHPSLTSRDIFDFVRKKNLLEDHPKTFARINVTLNTLGQHGLVSKNGHTRWTLSSWIVDVICVCRGRCVCRSGRMLESTVMVWSTFSEIVAGYMRVDLAPIRKFLPEELFREDLRVGAHTHD